MGLIEILEFRNLDFRNDLGHHLRQVKSYIIQDAAKEKAFSFRLGLRLELGITQSSS
jgi:hypothetical protein